MCEPVSMALTSLAMGGAQAITSYASASQQADAQNRSNAIARDNARQAFEANQAAYTRREGQEMDAASAKKADVALDTRRAVATNTVAAGEMGVEGPSVASLMRDIYMRQGRYDDSVDTNLDWTLGSIQDQKKSAGYALQDRLNGLRDVQKPSFLDTGLKIGAAGLNAASTYNTMTRKDRA